MPLINLAIDSNGPVLRVGIGVSGPRQAALIKAGRAVPEYAEALFLVDTGASCTCVDPKIIQPLGLIATGSQPMQTPSTDGVPHMCNSYDVALIITSNSMGPPLLIEAMPIFETSFSGQTIDGLLGRDVLSRCLLVYNGTTGTFSLGY